jgi:hypothetical protein
MAVQEKKPAPVVVVDAEAGKPFYKKKDFWEKIALTVAGGLALMLAQYTLRVFFLEKHEVKYKKKKGIKI